MCVCLFPFVLSRDYERWKWTREIIYFTMHSFSTTCLLLLCWRMNIKTGIKIYYTVFQAGSNQHFLHLHVLWQKIVIKTNKHKLLRCKTHKMFLKFVQFLFNLILHTVFVINAALKLPLHKKEGNLNCVTILLQQF